MSTVTLKQIRQWNKIWNADKCDNGHILSTLWIYHCFDIFRTFLHFVVRITEELLTTNTYRVKAETASTSCDQNEFIELKALSDTNPEGWGPDLFISRTVMSEKKILIFRYDVVSGRSPTSKFNVMRLQMNSVRLGFCNHTCSPFRIFLENLWRSVHIWTLLKDLRRIILIWTLHTPHWENVVITADLLQQAAHPGGASTWFLWASTAGALRKCMYV